MAKPIPWSYSRLNDFEKCPRMFQGKHVTKEFPAGDFEVYHLKRGSIIHETLQKYLETGNRAVLIPEMNPDLIYTTANPEHMKYNGKSVLKHPLEFLLPILDKLRASEGLDIENQKAFNTKFEEVSWFSNKLAWFRIIMDVKAFSDPTTLVIIDWKSGKPFGEIDQLKMAAGVGMKMHPEVTKVLVAYIFVDHPDRQPLMAEYTRADLDGIWQEFGDRAEMIQLALESGQWEPKPSKFNCTYCPALPQHCQYKEEYGDV